MNHYKYKVIIKTKDGSQKKGYYNVFENAARWVQQWLTVITNNGLPKDYITYSINLQ